MLSARILDPQFQGQIKERLTSRDALKLVAQVVKRSARAVAQPARRLRQALAELAIRQAQTRMKSAQKVEKTKGLRRGRAAGQAHRLRVRRLSRREVFLVEGDSAGGSAKMARDKEYQAILPLRGKVLNTLEVERDRLFANNEIHDIAVAIGVDPHGAADGGRPHGPALRRSSSWRTPTSTARTSRCCC